MHNKWSAIKSWLSHPKVRLVLGGVAIAVVSFVAGAWWTGRYSYQVQIDSFGRTFRQQPATGRTWYLRWRENGRAHWVSIDESAPQHQQGDIFDKLIPAQSRTNQ